MSKRIRMTSEKILALKDATELLSGKWKFCLLHNLYQHHKLQFKDLQEKAVGITPKVLSKELKELEDNLLVTRTVNNTKPITVTYQPTVHADEVQPVVDTLLNFGLKHRKKIKEK